MSQYLEYVNKIKNNSLERDDYFVLAKYINCMLSDNEDNQIKAREIVVYILEYWNNIPNNYKQLYTDIIAQCGFYPYLEKDKDKLDFNNLRMEIQKELHKSEFIKSDTQIYFHEAQNEVKELLLNTERNIVVSAPTSFGKSLLIEEIVASAKYNNILIIQPTLALLNETRNNLRKYDNIYQIIVRVSDKPINEKKHLFLLTAERVMEYKDLPRIDFFILDEFYKISQRRADERYEILNNACSKILNFHRSRFYFLGPNIDAISQDFIKKYNVVFKKYKYSLVVNEEQAIKNENKYYSDRKKDIKELKLFNMLENLDGQTIIYCSSPEKATNTAISFAKYLENTNYKLQNTEYNVPLISWICDNFSYKWDVILCLKHKIWLHNGAFPKHINAAIMDYFNNGVTLKYLFCTSTIIEGVNTSAKNVILYNDWRGKPNNKIDYFDYKNIKGRSGRMFKHYTGILYNFYPSIKEQDMSVDIPFVDQENPLCKEILAQTPEEDIKNKASKEYQELMKLPKDELELYKSTGLSIDGQKSIYDYINSHFTTAYPLLYWCYFPNFDQAEFILNLCFSHLLKETETQNVTSRKLATIIQKCNNSGSLSTIIKNEVSYYHDTLNKDYNWAMIHALQIQRHWFYYKIPKWFGAFNEIQKFICNKKGVSAGDYSYFISMIENDYISERASLLLEFDIPTTAIRKIDSSVPQRVPSEHFIEYIKQNSKSIASKLSSYEVERIQKEIL